MLTLALHAVVSAQVYMAPALTSQHSAINSAGPYKLETRFAALTNRLGRFGEWGRVKENVGHHFLTIMTAHNIAM